MIAVIGPAEVTRIREAIEFAKRNPKHPSDDKSILDDRRHLVELQVGVRCVITFDADEDGALWRHLSVSQATRRLPSPAALAVLAEQFGFSDEMRLLGPLPPDYPWVVHVIERCTSGDPSEYPS